MRFRNVFGSESPGVAGEVPRKFLALNNTRDVLFKDMVNRKKAGLTFWPGGRVRVPHVRLYQCSTVCRDGSTMDTKSPEPMDLKSAGAGMSSQTVKGAVYYLRVFRPLWF